MSTVEFPILAAPTPLDGFEQVIRGRDPKTVAAYMGILRDFVSWVSTRPGERSFRVELVTETAIRGYLDHLAAAGRAPRTRAKALSALRRFSRWATEEGLLRRNPAAYVEPPPVVQLAPKELSEDQRYVLKSLVERTGSRRVFAIFALGYWAGLRVSEVAELRVEDCEINQRVGALRIADSKHGKTRTIDLHNEARRALYQYIYENKHASDARDTDSEYVFTGSRSAWQRQRGRPDYLTARGIDRLWARLRRRATIDEWELVRPVRFHDLRHDFAHRARRAGWLREEIAIYLGHQTKDGAPAIATTVRYALPTREQLGQRLRHLRG